jgi:uncharacterized protein DUF222
MGNHRSAEKLIEGMDSVHAGVCASHRDLFRLIVRADRLQIWREWGARDLAHFLSMRYGISWWKANRWIACAHALEHLPEISKALATGELGIDKVVELTRLATPQDRGEAPVLGPEGVRGRHQAKSRPRRPPAQGGGRRA